jgi:hypothetical protein
MIVGAMITLPQCNVVRLRLPVPLRSQIGSCARSIFRWRTTDVRERFSGACVTVFLIDRRIVAYDSMMR